MLEQVAQFAVDDIVIYNPNLPNLKPFKERLDDIAKVIDLEGNYAKVQFLRSGFISNILITECPENWYFPYYRKYALTKLPANFDMSKIDE